MFGLPMEVPIRDDRTLTLRAIPTSDAEALSVGFSSWPVVQNLTLRASLSVEAESEWIMNQATSPTSYLWGMYLDGELIGNTGVDGIRDRRATGGCCIFRQDLWGAGIITAAHHATMFAGHQILGLEAIDALIYEHNEASRRGAERVGYTTYGKELNVSLINGRRVHADKLVWVNPDPPQWNAFWASGMPTDHEVDFKAARARSRKALKWSEANVTWL